MNKDLLAIFDYLEREKGIKRDIVKSAIEESLCVAARKTFKNMDNVKVTLDIKSGDIDVYVQKTIVEAVENPEEEISLKIAKELSPDCQLGQRVEILITPQDFGRIAAQTARQVISQKLREAERDVIYEEYRHRLNEIISGTIKRIIRGKTLIVDLGKVEAILPDRNYPFTEHYNIGERIQALLFEVHDTDSGGAEVILTRSHPEFVKALFEQEVPELKDKVIEIRRIVREPGYRTKIAVSSNDSKVDPIGTCVGVRGTRIKNVIRELNNEKIDVVPFSENTIELLQNAIAPIVAKRLKLEGDRMLIIVGEEDYPSIIGKKGMNARLLSRFIGYEINVQKINDYQKFVAVQMAELGDSGNPAYEERLKIEGLSNLYAESLIGAGYDTLKKVMQASPSELGAAIPGMNYLDLADKIIEQTKTQTDKN